MKLPMSENRSNFRVGVNVIVVRDGKLLLGMRKNCYGAGTWALPGGHLEQGEELAAGAARELLEETGLTADHIEFANIVNNPPVTKKLHYIQIGFTAIDIVGEPQNREPDCCEEWCWFELIALPDNIFPNHQKQIELFLLEKEKYGEEKI